MWTYVKEVIAECLEDKGVGLAVYMAVSGVIANATAAVFLVKWLYEHVRFV